MDNSLSLKMMSIYRQMAKRCFLPFLEVGLFRQFALARCEGYLYLMKRQLIALIVILALGLQGSLVVLAAAAPQMTDCQTPAESQDVAHKPCCPSGLHTASCCLDACLAAVAVTVSPPSLVWYGRTDRALLFRTAIFSSRGETPLTRPPIF